VIAFKRQLVRVDDIARIVDAQVKKAKAGDLDAAN
jgi:hypothetical protein